MTQRQLTHLLVAVAVVSLVACSGKTSPTSPSTTTTTTTTAQTRVIDVSGNMDFGKIAVGVTFAATLHVSNSGNAALTITGLTGSNGITNVTTASWTSGTIPAGGSQDITIFFKPTAPVSYSGTITLSGDQTSGTNSISFTGQGDAAIFSKSGTGDSVFTVPSYITKLKVIGTYTQSSSNFIVKIDGRLLVNELLGTFWGPTRYEGTLLSGMTSSSAGQIAITNSSGVAWSFQEVR